MRSINRREFLHDSAAIAAALAGSGALAAAEPSAKAAKTTSANDRLRVAVIGVHGRGHDHVKSLAGRTGCAVTVICDADEAVIGSAMKMVERAQGKAPRYEQDLRRVFDDKNIDIVTIATPNHWHALAAIWAMQAGKDVYVEKPVSHNVSEGRRIVEVARKHNRICQTGTQSRSHGAIRTAMDYVHAGKLGKIRLSRGLCYKLRPSIGKVEKPQPIPKTVNYDLWSGPAPIRELMRRRLHYDWHWIWDYGNGDLGNQGIHQMDIARWGLGKNELPKSVVSVGGRFGYIDDGETPNTQICMYDFGDCELIFEVRGLPTKALLGTSVGNILYGSEGYLVFTGSYGHAAAFSHKGEVIQKFSGGGDHFGNFLEAVRSRKPELLHADILEGHLSSALCHLGNISYRFGVPQSFNEKTQAFGDDKDAYESLARMEDHLKQDGVALDHSSYHLGPKLAIDPRTESFVNDPEADRYLTRKYRSPFVVPERV